MLQLGYATRISEPRHRHVDRRPRCTCPGPDTAGDPRSLRTDDSRRKPMRVAQLQHQLLPCTDPGSDAVDLRVPAGSLRHALASGLPRQVAGWLPHIMPRLLGIRLTGFTGRRRPRSRHRPGPRAAGVSSPSLPWRRRRVDDLGGDAGRDRHRSFLRRDIVASS